MRRDTLKKAFFGFWADLKDKKIIRGEREMKKGIKMVLAGVIMAGVLSNSGSAAFAQSQAENATYSGHQLECTLTTSWSLIGNDSATAKTYMKKWNGYQAKVKLLQCQNAVDSYHLLDTDFGDTTAVVKGVKKGGWKFKSYHSVYNKAKIDATRVCTLTDW